MRVVRLCSSSTSRRISSGRAARKSSDMPGFSGAGDSCLNVDDAAGSSTLLDATGGRTDTKLDWVSVMLLVSLGGRRPRRFLVGVWGLLCFEGPDDRGRDTGAADIEG